MTALQSQLRGFTRSLRDNLQRFVLPEARPTGRSLGTGSYGSVEEVEVNGMICAGKKIHEALLDAGNFGVQVIARKYAEECQLMTEMRHPHVVQFIGICFRAESALPLLVMERLETSLDDLLETTPDIPLTIKRSVLEGTARGLLYLHQRDPPVIHRDLTAKNILLTSSLEAKITDFGNSRMVDLPPGRLGTLSRLPGTLVYMPPEALADRARYGPSLDVFSFGHCALFICTQVFPGDLKSSTYPDPANAEWTLACSEVERRENYISQLEQQLLGGLRHPLVALIRQCLHNAPDRRPTTEGLIEQLMAMRAAIEGPYGDMVVKLDVARVGMSRALRSREAQLRELQQQMAQLETDKEAAEARVEGQAAELRERTAQVDTLQRQVRENNDQLRANNDHIRASDGEIRAKDDQIRTKDDEIRTKDDEIRAKVTKLQQMSIDSSAKDNQLQLKDREIASKASEIQQLQRLRDTLRAELAGREEQLSRQGAELGAPASQLRKQEASPRRKPPAVGLTFPLRLKWKRCRDMPFEMFGNPRSVLLGRKLYVGGGYADGDKDGRTVITYNLDSNEWSKLREYHAKYFAMAAVSGQLVLIGGKDPVTNKKTTKLAVWNEGFQNWTRLYSPMATACSHPAVASYNHYLIIAGGSGDDGRLTRVEVLDTYTNKWYIGAPLPQACYGVTSAIIEEVWYLMGGWDKSDSATKVVFKASLPALISSAMSHSASVAAGHSAPVWSTLPDTPLMLFHGLSLQGSLLAVGGSDSGVKNSAIHHYQASTENWVKVGDLPTARQQCACAALPSSGGFLLAGGLDDNGLTTRVDMATLANH